MLARAPRLQRPGAQNASGSRSPRWKDFRVGEDVLEFRSAYWGGQVEGLEDLAFSQVGSDTVISYGQAGESITLVGVDSAQLHLQAATAFLFT